MSDHQFWRSPRGGAFLRAGRSINGQTMAALGLTCLCFSAAVGSAQPSSARAEEQWANLQADWSALHKAAAPIAGARSQAQHASDVAQKAAQARQVSKTARDFYAQFPTNPSASAAKKIEVLSAIHGAADKNERQEEMALDLAKSYADQKSNPGKDRFEVAVTAERLQVRRRVGGELFENNARELEKIAEKLAGEFGNLPDYYDFYASVARGADMATAQRIASRILKGPASAAAKGEAKAIMDRAALLGRHLNVKLRDPKGHVVDLGAPSSGPTLLIVWSNFGHNLPGLAAVEKKLPASTRILYFSPGATLAQINAAKATAPAYAQLCSEPVNTSGAFSSVLKVRQTPYAFAVNRTGAFVGFGPISEVAELAAIANK